MQLSTPRAGVRRWAGIALCAATAMVAACGGERSSTDPTLPSNPEPNPTLRRAAFVIDVNTKTGTMRVSEPTPQVGGINGRLDGRGGPGLGGPDFSILAGDVIELSTSNFAASTVGQFTPGKVRITFDVNVTNELSSVQLITPTFPTPPTGVSGIILFPFEVVTIVTTGGTTVGGDGSQVDVEQPSRGQVDASVDWDGAPHNFFNDVGCAAGSNDCYRYQTFAQPLSGGATSEPQTIGFDLDPTVGNFRVRLIIAADLQNQSGPAVGTVAGNVTSPQRGALSGVTVAVQSGGFTGTTDGSGNYSIGSVTTGPKTVTLSNLPAQCTNPGPASTTVSNGGTATVNFTVQCTVPSGTLQGTISSSLGGGLSGVSVTATPGGGSALAPSITNGGGAYSIPTVPLGTPSGTGSIALGNLPANCADPGPQAYSGLTDGGSVTLDVTVSCTPPPAGYQVTNTWSAISGGTVTLTLRIDMGTFNDPAVNGAGPDDIFAIQGATTYSAARLQFASCSNVSGSGLSNGAFNGSTAGTIQWQNFTTTPPQTGLQGIFVCTFNVVAGAPGSATTGTSVSIAESQNSDNLVPRLLITEATLTIP